MTKSLEERVKDIRRRVDGFAIDLYTDIIVHSRDLETDIGSVVAENVDSNRLAPFVRGTEYTSIMQQRALDLVSSEPRQRKPSKLRRFLTGALSSAYFLGIGLGSGALASKVSSSQIVYIATVIAIMGAATAAYKAMAAYARSHQRQQMSAFRETATIEFQKVSAETLSEDYLSALGRLEMRLEHFTEKIREDIENRGDVLGVGHVVQHQLLESGAWAVDPRFHGQLEEMKARLVPEAEKYLQDYNAMIASRGPVSNYFRSGLSYFSHAVAGFVTAGLLTKYSLGLGPVLSTAAGAMGAVAGLVVAGVSEGIADRKLHSAQDKFTNAVKQHCKEIVG